MILHCVLKNDRWRFNDSEGYSWHSPGGIAFHIRECSEIDSVFVAEYGPYKSFIERLDTLIKGIQ